MQQWTWNDLLANVVPPCCREATFVMWQTILVLGGKGGAWCIPFNKRLTSGRSHNRGRRQQVRGPCSSIEIAKRAVFRTKCATLHVTKSPGNPLVAQLSCGISRDRRSFCSFIWALYELSKGLTTFKSTLKTYVFSNIAFKNYFLFKFLFIIFIFYNREKLCKTHRAAVYARYKCFIIITIIIII